MAGIAISLVIRSKPEIGTIVTCVSFLGSGNGARGFKFKTSKPWQRHPQMLVFAEWSGTIHKEEWVKAIKSDKLKTNSTVNRCTLGSSPEKNILIEVWSVSGRMENRYVFCQYWPAIIFVGTSASLVNSSSATVQSHAPKRWLHKDESEAKMPCSNHKSQIRTLSTLWQTLSDVLINHSVQEFVYINLPNRARPSVTLSLTAKHQESPNLQSHTSHSISLTPLAS